MTYIVATPNFLSMSFEEQEEVLDSLEKTNGTLTQDQLDWTVEVWKAKQLSEQLNAQFMNMRNKYNLGQSAG